MDKVNFKINNKIGILEINNPPVNALSLDLVSQFEKIISSLDRNLKILIIKGNDRFFCAGADLKERSAMNNFETISVVDSYRKLFHDIENIPCPTIARIKGYALGGGLELALSCDFRYLTKDSIIGFPETSLGIIPGSGGTQRLSKLIGINKAKKWILTANKFTAEQAFNDNVVDQCFDSEEEMDHHINHLIKMITNNSQDAVLIAKKTINYSLDHGLYDGIEFEKEQYLKTLDDSVRIEKLKKFKK